jgi:uncharacterized membrane protein YjjB (DUF3815 family)
MNAIYQKSYALAKADTNGRKCATMVMLIIVAIVAGVALGSTLMWFLRRR